MRAAWPLLLPVLLIGCGGGGSQGDTSFFEGRNGSVAVTFSEASGFNGNTTPLNGYTSFDGSAASKIVTVNATNVNRGVEVVMIASGLKSGKSVDLSGADGSSSVVYQDAVGRWTATSGTLTLDTRTPTSAQITLKDVVVENTSGGATGTAKLNGTLTLIGG